MKRIIVILISISSITLLSGCGERERIEELELEVSGYEIQIQNLKSIIEECDSNIDDAKAYVGGEYEEMEEALESLPTCQY